MLTAQDRESKIARELVCSPDGALVITAGPALARAFDGDGMIEDTDIYLLGVILNGGSSNAQITIYSGQNTLLVAKAPLGSTCYIPLPAPVRSITDDGTEIVLQGAGAQAMVYYLAG